MGSRDRKKPTEQGFAEVTEQIRRADELGCSIAWFAEHHFSNYCPCASSAMPVAHCASVTNTIRLGPAVVVLPLHNPVRLAAEIALAEALSNGRPRQVARRDQRRHIVAPTEQLSIRALSPKFARGV